jgi:nucleoside-diphosphate-sugar epimerase
VNFIGVKNVLSAMKENNVKKYIRITGATVGKSPFSPFRVLFAILLSLSGKWHEASEIAIRESGIDYTVLRPTGIKSEPSAASLNRSLILVPGDSNEKYAIPSRITVPDLADLVVLSLTNNKLKNCTVVCTSHDEPGETKWENLVNKKVMSSDVKKLKIGPYKIAISLYLTTLFTLLAVVTKFVVTSLSQLILLVK